MRRGGGGKILTDGRSVLTAQEEMVEEQRRHADAEHDRDEKLKQ